MNTSQYVGYSSIVIPMLFVAFITAIPGSSRYLIRRIKSLRIPEGIEVEKILALFGKYDHIIIFKAKTPAHADLFLNQLKEVARVKVRTATDIEKLKWTAF